MSEQVYIEQFWRDAKYEDALAEPPMVARFKNEHDDEWHIERLYGFDRSLKEWCGYQHDSLLCQVYDPPAYFEIGEGYRLIDVKTEKWHLGDEMYDFKTYTWRERLTAFQPSALSINRRRITPPTPPEPQYKYVPFTWEDREQLRGRWVTRSKDGDTIEEIAYKLDSRTFVAVAKHLLEDGWKFLDTGDPVGKKVLA